MGIYSTEAAKLFNENEVEFDPNAASLLEFAVNSQKAEHAMFESMLELDFLEYFSEAGEVVITEEEKAEGKGNALKAIGQKIVAVIEKLIQTIMTMLEKITNFVAEKTKIDKKLVEKFGKVNLEVAKANKPDKEVTIVDVAKAGDVASFIGARAAECKNIGTSGSKADYESKKANVEKQFKSVVNDELANAPFEKKKISELSQSDVDAISKAVNGGYKDLVESIIGKAAKNALKELKAARGAAMRASLPAKGVSEEDRAAAVARWQYVSELTKDIAKAINFGSNVATRAMAASRSSLIALGMAGKEKKVKEEATKEAAEFDYDELLEYALEVSTDNMYSEVSF